MERKYGIKVVTPSVSRPVSVSDAKRHMRIIGLDGDDEYIDFCIRAATEYVESKTFHTLCPTTYLMTTDQFPFNIFNRNIPYDHRRNSIMLPRNPVTAVTNFEYTDNDGNTNLITDYILSTNIQPARIVPQRGNVFPFADYYGLEAVRITFTAGYANDNYPYLGRQAILLMTAHMYEIREPLSEKAYAKVPMSIDTLINKLKIHGFVG